MASSQSAGPPSASLLALPRLCQAQDLAARWLVQSCGRGSMGLWLGRGQVALLEHVPDAGCRIAYLPDGDLVEEVQVRRQCQTRGQNPQPGQAAVAAARQHRRRRPSLLPGTAAQQAHRAGALSGGRCGGRSWLRVGSKRFAAAGFTSCCKQASWPRRVVMHLAPRARAVRCAIRPGAIHPLNNRLTHRIVCVRSGPLFKRVASCSPAWICAACNRLAVIENDGRGNGDLRGHGRQLSSSPDLLVRWAVLQRLPLRAMWCTVTYTLPRMHWLAGTPPAAQAWARVLASGRSRLWLSR